MGGLTDWGLCGSRHNSQSHEQMGTPKLGSAMRRHGLWRGCTENGQPAAPQLLFKPKARQMGAFLRLTLAAPCVCP